MTKIFCKTDYENSIIKNLSDCVNTLNEVNNNFNNMFIPNDFCYYSFLTDIALNINNINKDLINYKNNIIDDISKIKKIELEIQTKISKIDNITIKKIDI